MEHRLFPEGTIPEYTQPHWYDGRESAPHVEQDAHRGRLNIAAKFIDDWALNQLAQFRNYSVVDLGCGDGGLLSLLNMNIPAWGYDLAPANVTAGKARGVDVRYGNILEDELQWGELAVATECLEHLVDPHSFVRKIAQNSQYLVASSPYTETPDNAYEFHAWCWSIEGYEALMNQAGYKVVKRELWSMFQVLLCEREAS